MFSGIARFELRYQLTGPVFWSAFLFFLLLSFGSVASPYINIDQGGDIHKNAPTSIIATCFMFSLFFVLVVTAFAANVIVRDQETGFAPIIHTTRVSRSAYVFGRALGAFLVSALCFTSVPLGIFLGTLAPWVDPSTLGPNHFSAYLYAYALIALPTLLFLVALLASVAMLTRTVMASYIGALCLFLAYLGATFVSSQGKLWASIYSWTEPFGNAAIRAATRYWTTAESNRLLPPFTGAVLGNRVVAVVAGIALLLLARRLLKVGPRVELARQALAEAEGLPAPRAALPAGSFDRRHARSVLVLRTWFEVRQVLTGPAYLIMLILAIILTVISVANAGELFGTAIYPVTRVMISAASAGFSLFAIVIAIFYSGELVWHERVCRIDGIVDSTPIPNWAYVVPKTLALAAVLLSTLCVSVLADLAIQAAKGYTHFELGKYLLWYVLPQTVNWLLLAILAVFVQALAANKYAGWGLMLLYLIGTLVMAQLGLDHVLYNFNKSPPVPLSDMNGEGQFWKAWVWLKIYWAAFSLVLLVVSHILWRRGVAMSLKSRLRSAPGLLRGAAEVALAVGLAVFVASGAFIFYNTNVLNEYHTRSTEEAEDVAFERTFAPLASQPQPAVHAVKIEIDLFPQEQRFVSRGTYELVNDTAAPISDVVVRFPEQLEIQSLEVEDAQLSHDFRPFPIRAYRLASPMRAGEKRWLSFTVSRAPRGFSNDGITSPVVGNGTFLRNAEFAPAIGVGDPVKMGDKALRRKYGLPAIARMRPLEDAAARADNLLHADWTSLDITVSTDPDQTPLAPGDKVSDVTTAGRRTARFVLSQPVLNFISVQSARYAEKHLAHDGVDLAVYYHPAHSFNVDGMLRALSTGLDYFQANFGAYQFKHVDIVEFPAYGDFAQSFPGTIAYSEGVGFIADVRDAHRVDYVAYVTAHELAHQWWAHQIIGAAQQGATVLNETLAQYSALMVMEKLYGPAQVHRLLRYELDRYLRKRRGQQQPEMPLYRVEQQDYVHYSKGALVMYLLKERMGEANVNRALRSLLSNYRFHGAPYPSSIDLVAALREAAAPRDQALITDLFERIALMDLRASGAAITRRTDGKYEVSFSVEAHKFYADGVGEETEAPFSDLIDIGAFAASPDQPDFDAKQVLLMQPREIHSGVQRIELVLDGAPAFVGVDPYNKWIDRRPDDNVVGVPH